jgi:folate-dependent phosphoribosylglycinamide formyltransferase PurN
VRIYVLTQEDAFYIPRLLDRLLDARRDVVGIGVVPGELRAAHARRYWSLMGPRAFALQLANLAAHRALALAGRLLPLGRSYSVADAARRHRVPLEYVLAVNAPAFAASLRARAVDLLVSIACPQILHRDVLAAPRKGAINLHGSLLPDYRGLLPAFWVLANGETHTGATVHYMTDRVDRGATILQERIPIRADDTVHRLVQRTKVDVGARLLVQALELLEQGAASPSATEPGGGRAFSYPDADAIRRFRARGRRFV